MTRAKTTRGRSRVGRICAIDGCEKNVYAKDWCHTHWTRKRRKGDFLADIPIGDLWNEPRGPRHELEDRFWAKVNKDGPVSEYRPDLGPCWIWTANTNDAGYGTFFVAMNAPVRNPGAHRISYELVVGSIPEGYDIDHLCMVPACVNPSHLEAVTPRVNMERAWVARRWRAARQLVVLRGDPQ